MKTSGVHRACPVHHPRDESIACPDLSHVLTSQSFVLWAGVRSIYVGWDIPNVEVVAIELPGRQAYVPLMYTCLFYIRSLSGGKGVPVVCQ
jgi:hypothetical protein